MLFRSIALNFAQDYSGICYNYADSNYIIVSDESQQLIVWNPDANVIQSFSLDIQKAEGVVYNAINNRIYIVSDSEQKLYIYAFPSINTGF